ncbi:hypothetical protein [Modicisalibacter luteus]|uniref:hypothetical protein n=1 Tax=Modicisalibacter luteus TaxID=453962 RepID=UPI0036340CC3
MKPRTKGQRWPSFLFVLVYAIGAVLLAAYAIWHYLMGAYNDILVPASMSVLLSGAIFLRFANHDYRHLSAYLALISCYLLIAMELPVRSSPYCGWACRRCSRFYCCLWARRCS